MSPWIDVGRYKVPLSSIRSGTQDRAHHLGRAYRDKRHVRCMCVPAGVAMGVAFRGDPQPTYYLYHLHRADPALHHRSCPHFAEQQVAPSVEPHPVRHPIDASSGTQAGLHQLLERLVCSAGLNVWQPTFLEKRTLYRARFRLIEAAKALDVEPGHVLGESMYFPPIWDPSQKHIAEEEWRLFVEMLHVDPPPVHPFGYVVGLAKTVDARPDWSAPRLLLASHHTPFWLDHNHSLIPLPADQGHHWLVLLKVAPSRSRHGYRVVDGASLLLSSCWIPCMTAAHARLCDELSQSGVTFTAPLPHDPLTAWSAPDFLVQAPDGFLYRHGLFGATRVQAPQAETPVA